MQMKRCLDILKQKNTRKKGMEGIEQKAQKIKSQRIFFNFFREWKKQNIAQLCQTDGGKK